uniref:Transcriptional regulator n=1 Tax=Heterorhabditis bacteriophora TaxID=37862 RepID=A0A1I7W9T5_HETBA
MTVKTFVEEFIMYTSTTHEKLTALILEKLRNKETYKFVQGSVSVNHTNFRLIL